MDGVSSLEFLSCSGPHLVLITSSLIVTAFGIPS